jgi:hypothetical protein
MDRHQFRVTSDPNSEFSPSRKWVKGQGKGQFKKYIVHILCLCKSRVFLIKIMRPLPMDRLTVQGNFRPKFRI